MVVRLKRGFWYTLSLIFPYLRGVFMIVRAWHHTGRERYLLGWMEEGRSVEELKQYLAQHGFGNHFIAWKDNGEVCSIRRLDGNYQYHLRIYKDGEVRGHYEVTPESSVIKHFKDEFMEERRVEFMGFMPPWVVNFPQPEKVEKAVKV